MSAHADCIFCRIIAGEIPSHRVFENEHAFAFLDINPLARGHTLVIPRRHADELRDLPPAELARVAEVVPLVADRVLRAVGAAAYNLLQNNGAVAGQVVRHVHFHIIPRRADDGLGYRWNVNSAAAADLASLAAALRGG